jgi:hypothetical protein
VREHRDGIGSLNTPAGSGGASPLRIRAGQGSPAFTCEYDQGLRPTGLGMEELTWETHVESGLVLYVITAVCERNMTGRTPGSSLIPVSSLISFRPAAAPTRSHMNGFNGASASCTPRIMIPRITSPRHMRSI